MSLTSAWIAAPLMLFLAALGLRISWLRIKGVARSDEKRFTRWQRAHGNAVEHVPFAVLTLFFLELAGGRPALLIGLGVTLLVSRLLHAGGAVVPAARRLKVAGASLTYLVEAALGVLLLVQLAS